MYQQVDGQTPPLSERIAAAEAAEQESYEGLSAGDATGFATHRVEALLPQWHRVETDPATTDSQWLRTLVTATAPLPSGMPLAVVFTAESRARLERVLATCERAELDAHLTPADQLARAITLLVVQELVALHGATPNGGGR